MATKRERHAWRWLAAIQLSSYLRGRSARFREFSNGRRRRCRISSRLRLYFLIAAVSGCETSTGFPVESNADHAAAGMLRSVVRIRHYSALRNRALFWWAGLSRELPVEDGATLYRVEYWTTGVAGESTYASGLVAVPTRTALRGAVSYQHPTRSLRTNVPSAPSETASVAAIAFAGHGYVLTAPDYLGLGTSPGLHPYLHTATEARAVIDLLRAAGLLVRHIGKEWPQALFLTGFSQGAHASLAAQRAMEQHPVDGLKVTASAPIAGPYNLSGIQFASALEGRSANHAPYLGYLTSAYARIHNQPLGSVIAEPYVGDLPELYDGSKSLREIAGALPRDPRKMFRREFLGGFAAGEESWLTRALVLNDVFDWTPQAPVRFYYGTLDRDSDARDTIFTVEHMRGRGANVAAVSVGAKDHNEVVYAAVPRIRAWFDQLAEIAGDSKN